MERNDNDSKLAVGLRIKRARLKASLTQAQLGDLMGVSSTSVLGWERGRHIPDTKNCPTLARALNVSVPYILTGEHVATGPNVEQSATQLQPDSELISRLLEEAVTTGKGILRQVQLLRADLLQSPPISGAGA